MGGSSWLNIRNQFAEFAKSGFDSSGPFYRQKIFSPVQFNQLAQFKASFKTEKPMGNSKNRKACFPPLF